MPSLLDPRLYAPAPSPPGPSFSENSKPDQGDEPRSVASAPPFCLPSLRIVWPRLEKKAYLSENDLADAIARSQPEAFCTSAKVVEKLGPGNSFQSGHQGAYRRIVLKAVDDVIGVAALLVLSAAGLLDQTELRSLATKAVTATPAQPFFASISP